ncbi:MAG: DUF2284 domain-containing protein [Candidatus Izemoplasmatales bacterium]|jgi:predicted metal-binding protein|nr:DUF2284 domain-containing protein [Candidatus Izemoplasmatales bacterium]
MQKKIEDFLKNQGYTYAVIEPDNIIYREEFAAKCRMNYCGRYQKSWSCPPAIGDIEAIKKRANDFPTAILFQKVFPLEDIYDVEGMDAGRKIIMTDTLTLQDDLKKGNAPFFMLAAGSCSLCKECTYPDRPCRFPERMLISMEALGIDVAELARRYQLKYYNGPATVTYFAIVFFGE